MTVRSRHSKSPKPEHHQCPLACLQWHPNKISHGPLLLLRSRVVHHRRLHWQKTSPLSWSQSSAFQTDKPIRISRERKASDLIDRPSGFRNSRIEEMRKQPHKQRDSPRDPMSRYHLCLLWLMKSSGARVATLRRRRDSRWHMCLFERRITCLLSTTLAVTTWSRL